MQRLVATGAEVTTIEEPCECTPERDVERREAIVPFVPRGHRDDQQGNVERGQVGPTRGETQRHCTWCQR